jgi:hypothetical protein
MRRCVCDEHTSADCFSKISGWVRQSIEPQLLWQAHIQTLHRAIRSNRTSGVEVIPDSIQFPPASVCKNPHLGNLFG